MKKIISVILLSLALNVYAENSTNKQLECIHIAEVSKVVQGVRRNGVSLEEFVEHTSKYYTRSEGLTNRLAIAGQTYLHFGEDFTPEEVYERVLSTCLKPPKVVIPKAEVEYNV